MGGGGVMRAAAKFAGIGVVTTGLRGGVPAVPLAEQSVRKASFPVASAIISSKSSGKGATEVAEVQRSSWETEDWEFAGGEEELVLDSGEPMARVVFERVPTIQEAKEATTELKDALEKAYLSSPKSTAYGDQVPGLSLISNPEYLETKSCVTYGSQAAPVPNYATKAITLLSESPAAQSVVASIVCDANVWKAVLQNEALTEFLESHKANAEISDLESVADAESPYQESLLKSKGSSDASESGTTGSGLKGILENMKLTVVEMVNNVSGFLQNIFGFSAENSTGDTDGNPRATSTDKTLGASFMALALMAIMVVVLKRG